MEYSQENFLHKTIQQTTSHVVDGQLIELTHRGDHLHRVLPLDVAGVAGKGVQAEADASVLA